MSAGISYRTSQHYRHRLSSALQLQALPPARKAWATPSSGSAESGGAPSGSIPLGRTVVVGQLPIICEVSGYTCFMGSTHSLVQANCIRFNEGTSMTCWIYQVRVFCRAILQQQKPLPPSPQLLPPPARLPPQLPDPALASSEDTNIDAADDMAMQFAMAVRTPSLPFPFTHIHLTAPCAIRAWTRL